ncbi:MAG TPA: Flp pilus assembly protein CpaB [Gaiellaceae bacterium]
MTKSRLRNLALPLGLATLAAILIGIYVISYRNSVTHGAGLVKVLVAARDIPAGTDGPSIAGGGYLTTQTVPRRAVVPGSVTSAGPLTSLVAGGVIYKGQQITLRQFTPISQGGIFAKFSGNERVVAVPGDSSQVLAGTLSDGDRVDVVATTKYHVNDLARAASRVVLRNLLVLKAADGSKTASVGGANTETVSLIMTDRQTQTMAWAMKQGTWFLVLRPTNRPQNSSPTIATIFSFLYTGLPPAAQRQVAAANFQESIDAP